MTKEILKKIVYLALVLIWMLIVFMFSNQNGEKSKGTSQKISDIVVELLTHRKEISENEKNILTENVDYVIRKLAHYTIYVLGGILIYNYIRTFNVNEKKAIYISILFGTLYAITDEIHQYFMVGRSAQINDVLIDSLGICTGVFLIHNKKKP